MIFFPCSEHFIISWTCLLLGHHNSLDYSVALNSPENHIVASDAEDYDLIM